MRFIFKGVSEYLEDLVTCIDVPQLDNLDITFFNQIDFDTPRLAQFINRTPTFRARNEGHVRFHDRTVDFELTYRTHKFGFTTCRIGISCRELDWQLSSIAQVCNSSLLLLSMVEDLYIGHRYWQLLRKNDAIEDTLLWLELLLPFTAAKNLYLAEEVVSTIAATLQQLVGNRITEVLPSLQNIFIREPFQEHIE